MSQPQSSAASTRTVEEREANPNGRLLNEVLTIAEATAKEIGMSRSKLELIKDVYAKGATDQELAMFIGTAARLGLSIEARQIFLVKRYDKSLGHEVATPQVSIDGQRLVADRTDKYVPGPQPTYEYKGDRLNSATSYVKKLVAGEWHTIAATAYWDEYVQTKKDGHPNNMWSKYPHVMLAKCAESLALRKAFPNELSGVYTDAEMGTETDMIIGGETRTAVDSVQQPITGRPAQDVRRATKGQLIDQARSQASVDVESRRAYIKDLLRAVDINPYLTLRRIDDAPEKIDLAFENVARTVIGKVLNSDKLTEAGKTELLESYGVTELKEASHGQLTAIVDGLVKDGHLNLEF